MVLFMHRRGEVDRNGGIKRRFFSFKDYLIDLNVDLDHSNDILDNSTRWNATSLTWLAGRSEFERYALLLEDRRYLSHAGIDYWCFPRLIRQFFTFKRMGGISTIEQQFVRTVTNRRERTAARKIREVILARVLNYHASKDDILRCYLGIAYFGYGVQGADQAAYLLFGADAAELKEWRAALLASLLVYPVPRQVVEAILESSIDKGHSKDSLFSATKSVAPHWSRRAERRMNYALSLMRNIDQPRK